MEAAQTEHGDIGYWNRVTDVNYEDGQYCGTLQEPPTVHVVDFSGYDGPLDENGFPVGLPNEIAEYMKQHGEPPTVPKIIIKKKRTINARNPSTELPAGGFLFLTIRKFVFLSGSEVSRKPFILHAHKFASFSTL